MTITDIQTSSPQPSPTMSWTRLVMASRHLFFGCAVLGNVAAVNASAQVREPLDRAARLAGERFLEAEFGVLSALADAPGVDPGFTTNASTLIEGARDEVTTLTEQAGAAAVVEASPDPAGITLVQFVEWDGVWLEHVELTAGHLENRRHRIEEAAVAELSAAQ